MCKVTKETPLKCTIIHVFLLENNKNVHLGTKKDAKNFAPPHKFKRNLWGSFLCAKQ